MRTTLDFRGSFQTLTGNLPFPWQESLYRRFAAGEIPSSCNLPTGLGKTSVVAVWLLALAKHFDKLPRRLVYVVNRRTVVDQTTAEVEAYRRNAAAAGIPFDFALSTLRGQFADNREWSADPSRPAIICGTVDMVGSRLLFSGYGVGWKARPLHAGFLGQDALLVHDEAHLEPAFQSLVESVETEQRRGERTDHQMWPRLKVMELTATSRTTGDTFPNSTEKAENDQHPEVKRRIYASKKLTLEPQSEPKKLAEQVATIALGFRESSAAILIFVRTVDDVMRVQERLRSEKLPVETLTGTMRGKERDDLVDKSEVFARFLPKATATPANGTVYLVCTSAGEVGVNISADHLVCDLTTFESMAQRFGRVNRFGLRGDTEVHVVYPADFDANDAYDVRRENTLVLLSQLDGDVSPESLGKLHIDARLAAFAPIPTILPATASLYDAWALTSIRDRLPGRPHVEPYLHGLPTDWQPPETMVAWREEVSRITGSLLDEYPPAEMLDVFPLKPHELLREPSYRAIKQLEVIAKRAPDAPVWLLEDDGQVTVLTLEALVDKRARDQINGRTLILSPEVGGLEGGMLNGKAESAVADVSSVPGERVRVLERDPQFANKTAGLRLVYQVVPPTADEDENEGESWLWFEAPREGGSTAYQAVELSVHVRDVVQAMDNILANLKLSGELKAALRLAAELHDHGKRRIVFQRALSNARYPAVVLAKSRRHAGKIDEKYRHEFGSLVEIREEVRVAELDGDLQDLVRHLIAAHHGRARPHFGRDEAFDPDCTDRVSESIACQVPQRFARLQRRYGRWGLAYLESILRAADWAASANPSAFWEGK